MYPLARSTLFFRLYKACLNFLRQCDTPRNLPTVWSAILRLDNSDDLREQGKAKREVMSEKGKQGRAKQLGGVSVIDIPQDATPTTREKIAAAAVGVATGTVAKAEVGVSTGYIGGVQSKYPHAHGSNLPE